MKMLKTTLYVLLFATTLFLNAQFTTEEIKKHSCILESTAFVWMNFVPDHEWSTLFFVEPDLHIEFNF